jgi:predicted DNA-binding transcriptional regulator YafY
MEITEQKIALEKAPLSQRDKAVKVYYTNYRGETAWRVIYPENIFFGSTQWHPEMQWLLRAYDPEKQDFRDFAIKDISSWIPLPEN